MIGGSVAGAAVTAGGARAQSQTKSARTTFVLVHGASCGGWIWRRVADILESRSCKVYCPTLTGLGERSHLLSPKIDLETHILDVANLVEWESLENVCLVAHSYAGFPSSGALERIAPRVSSLVLLDAFKPADGERAIDYAADRIRRVTLARAAGG
ncbi:MAG: alpha/beta fold hydrolase, partial [Hyphomicrobiales bacterium]|nr:alpha/beta fold hydrolase [Hyphomicrobiales bacterium]